jgi:hypothetical protein
MSRGCTAFALAIVVAVSGCSSKTKRPRSDATGDADGDAARPAVARASFEVVEVADDLDLSLLPRIQGAPTTRDEDGLPRTTDHVRWERESVNRPRQVEPAKPGGLGVRSDIPRTGEHTVHFLQTDLADDTDAQAHARLTAFAVTFVLPEGTRFAIGVDDTPDGPRARTYVLRGNPILTGDDVAGLRVVQRDDGVPSASLRIDLLSAGHHRLADATARLVGARIAMLVAGRVRAVPVVRAAIDSDSVDISMGAGSIPEQLAAAERLRQTILAP